MQVKIGDFGLATRVKSLLDRKRTVCGTPNYIGKLQKFYLSELTHYST